MLIIAIDGPSGVGKGTLAVNLAEELRLNYLNSGSIYRSIAYIAEINSINLNNTEELINIGSSIIFNIKPDSHDVEIIYEGKKINNFIFSEETAKRASKISSNKKLRLSIPLGIFLIIEEYKAQQETHPSIQISPTTKFKEPKFRILPLIIIFMKPIKETITPMS